MASPIILKQNDFAPLLADPNYMSGLIDALERSLLDDLEGTVRQHTLADEVKTEGEQSSLRFSLIAGQGKLNSLLGLGAGAGVNSRYLFLFDGATRDFLALMDSGLLNPVRVGAEGGLSAWGRGT